MDIELIDKLRVLTSDSPQHVFNEITTDGENASWVLRQKPVEEASESVFISGILQQNGSSVTTLTTAATLGDYELTVNSVAGIPVGGHIVIGEDPDPNKYEVLAVDTTAKTVSLNKALKETYVSGSTVYLITKDYSMDYKYGVVYFSAAPPADATLMVTFDYTSFTNRELDILLTQAAYRVSSDLGTTVTADTSTAIEHLILLMAQSLVVQKRTSQGATKSIKIRQGSTALDLTNSSRALQDQMKAANQEYDTALKRYMMGLVGDGEFIVGNEDMINV